MNLINKIITVFLLLFSTILNGQNFNHQKLTTKQMYKDFDQLAKIIEEGYVILPVIKSVTGYDILKEVKSQKQYIDTITSYNSYISFLNNTMILLVDPHSREATDYYLGSENLNGIDTAYIKKLKEYYKSDEYRRYYNSRERANAIFPIYPYYYNGDYYMRGNHNLINKNKDTLNIHCMKIISYNGEDFTEYVEKNFKDSWDYKNKKIFRGGEWMPLPDHGIIKGEQDGKMIEFNMSDYHGRILNDRTQVDLDNIPVKKGSIYAKNKQVKYFEKDSILFIYLDRMSEDTSFYNKIKLEGANKFIKKVIIDVRDNEGGNDLVWHKTLKAIIKDTLPYPIQIAFNDNKLMRNKLINYKRITRFEKIGYLDNCKYGIISDTSMTFVPDTNSIKYSGKIYILTNRGTYSSAHALASYADYLENMVSIGESRGQVVGFGIMPQLFQLKYSKFTFRLATSMDVTYCKKPLDVYHDFPEIEVIPTIEEVLLYPHSGYDIKSEEYLYKYDSMFKKVLELK